MEGSRDRARALVYVNVRDVIFCLGLEGDQFRFLEINPAFSMATGLSEERVVGKLVGEVIPEPSLSMVLTQYRLAIRERRTVRWEEVTEYPTGKKYGEVSVTPVIDSDGLCRTLVGTVHDITVEARARALRDTEQRVLEMAASGESLANTLTALVLGIEEQTPQALASILLVTADGAHVAHGAAPHLPDAYNRAIDGARFQSGAGSCGTAMAERRPVIVEDIETDPLWDDYRELARTHGLRACWSTPILSREGRVLGSFALYYRQPRLPTQEDLDLIARAVHVAAIAIQRHELDEQLRAFSARVQAAREEERAGIAREIHDQLGQSLTGLKIDLAWIARRASSAEGIATPALLAKVAELSGLSDEIIQQVRRISAQLRPAVLDDLGLGAALTWKSQEVEKRCGIACNVAVDIADGRVARDVATAAFRVFEEALTNVLRHADAKRVDVRLAEMKGWLVLEVIDDGKGIQPKDIVDPRALGLMGMRERARHLGGRVSLSPRGHGGTVVTLRLPLHG